MLRLRRIALAAIMAVAVVGAVFASESGAAAKKPSKVTYKNLSYKDFSTSYAAMRALVPLAAKGSGSATETGKKSFT